MSTDMPNAEPLHPALLVLPRLRVQNANAISSPLTWGFPAITAFTGFMVALARRLGADAGIHFQGVGVVCHGFEAQVTTGGYTRSFALTRNPVLADGSTAAIVEEGRVHLDITLVLDVRVAHHLLNDEARAQLAARVGELVAGMRLAGGSVMPPLPHSPTVLHRTPRTQLILMAEDAEARATHFKRLRRRWLPGFALVSRDDLLQQRLAELQAQPPSPPPTQPQEAPTGSAAPTLLDAWLDLSRINHRAVQTREWDEAADDYATTVAWQTDHRPGWLVPMPVGFAALSALHAPGEVANARDPAVPFRFVESVYSMGQWVSPHRLRDAQDLMWRAEHDAATGLYRCTNAYQAAQAAAYTPVSDTD